MAQLADGDFTRVLLAANALSDVYAMGGDPATALNIVGFPKGKLDTKPLGTGIITTALKRRKAARKGLQAAVASMVALNRAASLPLLPGAVRLADEGMLTGGCTRNRAYLADKVAIAPSIARGLVEVAFDPQTSGGLLIAVPAAQAGPLVEALHAQGVTDATIVGHAIALEDAAVRLV